MIDMNQVENQVLQEAPVGQVVSRQKDRDEEAHTQRDSSKRFLWILGLIVLVASEIISVVVALLMTRRVATAPTMQCNYEHFSSKIPVPRGRS